MKEIFLYGKHGMGKSTAVDDEDFEVLNQFKWFVQPNGYGKDYVVRNLKEHKKTYMHRQLLNTPDDMYVDHVDGDSLNNRRNNLRLATNQENQLNRGKPSNNTTGFKGVYPSDGGRWRARLFIHHRGISGGCYASKKEAAKAYNQLAVKYFGEFAWQNPL